ncbi:MAG: 6,7-dimethyl-8-ribityllumazine synthase [Ilumatobacter sp.]
MTSPDAKPTGETPLDGDDLVVGVVCARWNADIVDRLCGGAQAAAIESGATPMIVSAPGAFELPYAASVLAHSGDVDAIVVLGAVIRGETTHYEIVSQGCASGVMKVQLDTGIPVGLGILTVEDHDQALARSCDDHNVGRDATLAAIEMAVLARTMLPAEN